GPINQLRKSRNNIMDATTITISPIELMKQNAQKDNELLKMSMKMNTVAMHLSKFLDEFEGAWDSDETCASPEIAQDYIDAAKYMMNHFGRINNRIRDVEEWLNNYLPFN